MEKYVANVAGIHVPFNNCVTGSAAFTHKAGVHSKVRLGLLPVRRVCVAIAAACLLAPLLPHSPLPLFLPLPSPTRPRISFLSSLPIYHCYPSTHRFPMVHQAVLNDPAAYEIINPEDFGVDRHVKVGVWLLHRTAAHSLLSRDTRCLYASPC